MMIVDNQRVLVEEEKKRKNQIQTRTNRKTAFYNPSYMEQAGVLYQSRRFRTSTVWGELREWGSSIGLDPQIMGTSSSATGIIRQWPAVRAV